jgi:hypothetical protein
VAGVTDSNGSGDLFLWSRLGGSTTLVSHAAGLPLTTGGNEGSFEPLVSADGSRVAFASGAIDLVSADGNAANDAFYFGPEEIFTDGFARGTPGAWSASVP